MTAQMIKVLTNEGYVTLNRTKIITIDPIDEGTRIMLLPHPSSETTITIDCTEQYEDVLESYFTG